MTENWKPVIGYEHSYEVSDIGQVRGLDRFDSMGRRVRGRMLRQKLSSGYSTVVLCANGLQHNRRVHILVLEAFVCPRPEGMEGCHFPDDDRTNCRLDNLRWDTSAANKADRIAHGTANRGARHGMSKLVRTDVERIFDLRRNGCLQQEIADWFGITKSNVSSILLGKSWKHFDFGRAAA